MYVVSVYCLNVVTPQLWRNNHRAPTADQPVLSRTCKIATMHWRNALATVATSHTLTDWLTDWLVGIKGMNELRDGRTVSSANQGGKTVELACFHFDNKELKARNSRRSSKYFVIDVNEWFDDDNDIGFWIVLFIFILERVFKLTIYSDGSKCLSITDWMAFFLYSRYAFRTQFVRYKMKYVFTYGRPYQMTKKANWFTASQARH